MYKLDSYFSSFTVKPGKIIYEMANYHGVQDSKAEKNGRDNSDAVNELKQKQICLVNDLTNFHKKLAEFMKKQSNNRRGLADNEQTKAKGPNSNSTSKEKASGAKKQDNLAEFSLKTHMAKQRVNMTNDQVLLHDYMRVKDQKLLFELHCHESDRSWLEMFSRIGAMRGVFFNFNNDASECDKTKVLVKFDAREETHLLVIYPTHGDLVAQGHVAIWKLLGSLLGLYAIEDSATSMLSDKWLLKGRLLIHKRYPADSLNRELSNFLSSNDFLSSQSTVLLSDIVLFSILSKSMRYPSNVELWRQRIDNCINRA